MDKSLQEALEAYNYAKERHGFDSKEYETAIQNIEDHITDYKTKEIIADAILSDNPLITYGDDYLQLWNLRKLDLTGDPEVNTALDYFLNSEKPFPVYCTEVMFIAMRQNKNITSFLQNLCIVDSHEFIKKVIRDNEIFGDLASVLQNYLKNSPFIKEAESIKSIRILSALASFLAGNNLDLFEASIRLQHKYLKKVYREDIYNERWITDLPEHDGFAFFVGTAFECKDNGDTIGFTRNLRQSLRIMPGMREIVALLGEKVKKESTPAQELLDQETSRIKSIIYTMIDSGNMAVAEQVLQSYIEVNPNDPEIEEIREKIIAG